MASDIPEICYRWFDYPFSILCYSTRQWFARHLDPRRDTFGPNNGRLQDWRGVAEILGFDSLDLDNFELQQHPSIELFKNWSINPEATVGTLIKAIREIERFDILLDPQLISILERDVNDHLQKLHVREMNEQRQHPVQVQEVVSSSDEFVDEFKNITVGEAQTGIPEKFDAFVCYTSKDFDFVRDMMHRLETVHGLKLCIPDRDLMPGCAKYVILAKLIQERCRKMIIVLSPDYTLSDECRFQTLFAHSLAPGAQQKKLIPIVYRQCTIPPILNYICLVDYTRCDVVDWFWGRLANSLKADKRNLFEPFAPTPALMQHRNQQYLAGDGGGNFPRNDSQLSLTCDLSTQSLCSSGIVTTDIDTMSITTEHRCQSSPVLAAASYSNEVVGNYAVTPNLIYPDEWRARNDGDNQSACSFDMEIIDPDASRTVPNESKKTKKSIFSEFFTSKILKPNSKQ